MPAVAPWDVRRPRMCHRASLNPNNSNPQGDRFVSPFMSLPPISPGIAYAVRKLLEYAPASESEARDLCSRLWPKMDVDATQTVLAYWQVQVEPEKTLSPTLVVTKIGRERVMGEAKTTDNS